MGQALFNIVASLFLACWFANHVPSWVRKAYDMDVRRHGKRENLIQGIYEIFCEN